MWIIAKMFCQSERRGVNSSDKTTAGKRAIVTVFRAWAGLEFLKYRKQNGGATLQNKAPYVAASRIGYLNTANLIL